MRDLMRIAADMGLRVHVAHFDDDPDLLGYYSHRHSVIVLRMGLTPDETRCVLAHELAHAFYGDSCSDGPHERRAERHAAAFLIRPAEYANAEAINAHPAAIAEELGVTVDVVETYQQQCLQRIGSTTYGRQRRVGLYGERARQLSS